MKVSGKSGCLAFSAIVAVAAMASQASAEEKKYVVGVSNTLIGNGWREEMVCSIKAEALASGKVSKVILANRNGGPSEQIADIRNLISAGANIIIINPSDRKALDPVIKQATDRGIVVVAVDQAVDAPSAYVLSNDQTAYGRLGAEALFKKLGGKGNVVELRGIDGVPADADRHEGFTEALKNYPDIKVVASVFTGWSAEKAAQQMKDLLGSGKQIDGIWTSGTDYNAVAAYKDANKKFVPVVGADGYAFMGQELELKDAGLVGINVTNPPAVGGAGLAVALDVLDGKQHPHITHLTPEVYDSTTSEGQQWLKTYYDPKVDPALAIYSPVKPYTHYTIEQEKACKGPRE
ncbi:MAG: substrate-binding domain-containing protein [Hyphomicrobiales bacterium]|nr:substrate-binding domain-containing protein [Hyphomicrobiales bacterium]